MKLITTFLEKIKNQPEIWIFYIFLLVFPLTIRKVIFFYPLGLGDQKTFNEYSGIYLYLSDIFILAILFFWIVTILYTKRIDLSIMHWLSPKKLWITCVNQYKKIDFNEIYSKIKHFFIKLFHSTQNVPRGTFNQLIAKKYKQFKKGLLILINKLSVLKKLFHVEQLSKLKRTSLGIFSKCSMWNIWKDKLVFIPLLLVFWSFLSIIWSENHLIAFFRSLKILEFFFLYLFIKNKLFNYMRNVPRGTSSKNNTILRNISYIVIFLGILQALIGIWQFIIQKSVGLFWFRESLISPEILGVAKIIIGGEKYIRSYGLFPHPNILGGFLLFSIIITYAHKQIFHPATSSNVPHGTLEDNGTSVEHLRAKTYSTFSLFFEKIYNIVPRGTCINIFLGIQILGLMLTFSKSAIIGLLIAIIYIYINRNDCSTLARNNSQSELGGCNIRQLKYLFILSFLLFGILLFYFKIDLYALFIQSIQERFIYLAASVQAIIQNMLWGLGNGQFVLEMAIYSFQNLEFWQFQPVHNVFLLIFSELGMIGLFLFVWFILELFHIEQSQDKNKCSTWNIYFKSILLGFIFIIIFDHYLWDIQQGSLVLWMVMGLIVAKK